MEFIVKENLNMKNVGDELVVKESFKNKEMWWGTNKRRRAAKEKNELTSTIKSSEELRVVGGCLVMAGPSRSELCI